jgi:hypothetical protein
MAYHSIGSLQVTHEAARKKETAHPHSTARLRLLLGDHEPPQSQRDAQEVTS